MAGSQDEQKQQNTDNDKPKEGDEKEVDPIAALANVTGVDKIPEGEEATGNYIPRERFNQALDQIKEMQATIKRLEMQEEKEKQDLEKARMAQLEKEQRFEELWKTEKEKAEQAKQEVRAAQTLTLQTRVGTEMKLHPLFWDRLRGDTEAEMKLDAALLLEAMDKRPSVADANSGRASLTTRRGSNEAQLLNEKRLSPTYRDKF